MPMDKSLAVPLSVAIVEDEDDTRAWLAASVAAHPELLLAGEYASGARHSPAWRRRRPMCCWSIWACRISPGSRS